MAAESGVFMVEIENLEELQQEVCSVVMEYLTHRYPLPWKIETDFDKVEVRTASEEILVMPCATRHEAESLIKLAEVYAVPTRPRYDWQ